MTHEPPSGPKRDVLRDNGALNPHPERVTDTEFQYSEFFDPLDLVQVKYEMLRRVNVERARVSEVSARFGLSRVSFYQAALAFQRDGLMGLLPKKRGPRGGHKLTDDVMLFVEELLQADRAMAATTVATEVEQRFELRVHPRTIERALQKRKKKAGDLRPASSANAGSLSNSYEALRRGELHPGSQQRRSWGRTLLVRQGMASWMLAWASYLAMQPRQPMSPPVQTNTASNQSQSLLREFRADAVHILASMVLATPREVLA